MSEPTPEEIDAVRDPAEVGDQESSRPARRVASKPDIQRLLPQSSEAEQGVLAAFLLSPNEVGAFLMERKIGSNYFHIPAHATVFEVLMDIFSVGKPLDFIIITKELRGRGKLDAVGGASFLTHLYTFLATATNAEHYIGILQEKYIARQIIRVGTEFAARAYEEHGQVAELAADFHGAAGGIIYRREARQSIREIIQEIVDEVREGKDDSGLVKTGIPHIDDRLALYRGDALIITAPTSCGKTALAAQIGLGIAGTGGRVGFYPLEMRQKQTLKRAIAQLGGNNADFVRKNVQHTMANPSPHSEAFTQKLIGEFMEAARRVADLPVYVRDDLYTIEQIRADIRAEHAKQPFTYVLIDYLQLIQSSQKFERKQLLLANICQSVKNLANELGCVVCIPSQVNKEGGTREAQDAENDASALIKIHPLDDKSNEPKPGRVTIWKQREGSRHVELPLQFNPVLTRFDYGELPK